MAENSNGCGGCLFILIIGIIIIVGVHIYQNIAPPIADRLAPIADRLSLAAKGIFSVHTIDNIPKYISANKHIDESVNVIGWVSVPPIFASGFVTGYSSLKLHSRPSHHLAFKGDSLSKISEQYKVELADLLQVNWDDIEDPSKYRYATLKIDHNLKIPRDSVECRLLQGEDVGTVNNQEQKSVIQGILRCSSDGSFYLERCRIIYLFADGTVSPIPTEGHREDGQLRPIPGMRTTPVEETPEMK